jgi:hypothetical protein
VIELGTLFLTKLAGDEASITGVDADGGSDIPITSNEFYGYTCDGEKIDCDGECAGQEF